MPSINNDGEVLVKNKFLSLDPYMRGRMSDAASYAEPVKIDAVMIGGTIGVVIESRNPAFPVGSLVSSYLGWQAFAVVNPAVIPLQLLPSTPRVPLPAYLGAVGMPGVTAWKGIHHIIKPAPGETVLVSSAAGAVGSAAGQLAKIQGCHVIGIAGGKDKCDLVVKEYGFDACIDYKQYNGVDEIVAAIKEHAPKGVDGYFENVGGDIGNAALRCMNTFGRIAVCGLISAYEGASYVISEPRLILTKRLLLQGFIIGDDRSVFPEAMRDLEEHVVAGRLKYRETILEGLEAAPRGLLSLLDSTSFGKLIVHIQN
jgi:NADPH-dependent curcumin reductase CurA